MNDTPSSVRVNSYKIIHVNKCISYVWNVIIIVTMMLELSFHALYILHYYSSFRLSLYIYIYNSVNNERKCRKHSMYNLKLKHVIAY